MDMDGYGMIWQPKVSKVWANPTCGWVCLRMAPRNCKLNGGPDVKTYRVLGYVILRYTELEGIV